MFHTGSKEQGYKGNSVETQKGAEKGKSKITTKVILRKYREDGEERAEVGGGKNKG
jgi:hypothetical protein